MAGKVSTQDSGSVMDATNEKVFSRLLHTMHVHRADMVAILAALLSLLTFTVILPSGLHLP